MPDTSADFARSGPFGRQRQLAALAAQPFDVLVIGGGITGCGVVLDAASRGLRAALVERDDFASGTSTRSSKLVHGGLRYLHSGDIRLVREGLRERQRLLRNAPHLVHVLPFLLPMLQDGPPVSDRAIGAAMWAYDLAGAARIGRHRRLSGAEAFAHMPTFEREAVRGGYLYFDAQADDARLTLQLARTATLDFGAVVANHVAVVELPTHPTGRVCGAVVEAEDGRRIEVTADCVVNAAGIWTDEVLGLDGMTTSRTIRPARGVHVAVPWSRLRNDVAVIVPGPGDDRPVFVIPWLRHGDGTFAVSYIGTTDIDYNGDLNRPPCTSADIEYLLGAVNRWVGTPLEPADVVGTWSGLRPLVDGAPDDTTSDLSRRHRVVVGPNGVVSVTGGKLTTYRQMAEDAVDVVLTSVPSTERRPRCRTRRLPIRGSGAPPTVAALGVAADIAEHLVGRFGSEALGVAAGCRATPGGTEPLVPGLPYLRGEALHAVRNEMACSLADVLCRRTRAAILDRDATLAAASDVADVVAADLGWSRSQQLEETASFAEALARATATGPIVGGTV